MTPEEQAAAAAAAKAEAEAKAKAEADAAAKATAEAEANKGKETIGQVLDPKPETKTVPEAAFLDLKKDNKQLRQEIKDLQERVADGASKTEVSADIKALGEKYDVKPEFLTELSTAIGKQLEAATEERLKPFTAQEKQRKIDEAFTTGYDAAMASMPEFKDIVNPSVIKALSLDPKNHSKTFSQLIEETYGKAVPGKRTLETTTHRGGATGGEVDLKRTQEDPKYLDEVLADPERKKEYNKGLLERLSSVL